MCKQWECTFYWSESSGSVFKFSATNAWSGPRPRQRVRCLERIAKVTCVMVRLVSIPHVALFSSISAICEVILNHFVCSSMLIYGKSLVHHNIGVVWFFFSPSMVLARQCTITRVFTPDSHAHLKWASFVTVAFHSRILNHEASRRNKKLNKQVWRDRESLLSVKYLGSQVGVLTQEWPFRSNGWRKILTLLVVCVSITQGAKVSSCGSSLDLSRSRMFTLHSTVAWRNLC